MKSFWIVWVSLLLMSIILKVWGDIILWIFLNEYRVCFLICRRNGLRDLNFLLQRSMHIGCVVHLHDSHDMNFFPQRDDILIVSYTDVGWTPYFPLLGGLVTEMGGLVSHGAVVAREFQLPCVVNVPNATRLLQSGGYKSTVNNEFSKVLYIPYFMRVLIFHDSNILRQNARMLNYFILLKTMD